METLIKVLDLLDILEDLGLLDYQVESLHNIIMDMIDLNNQDRAKKNKKVYKNVKK